MTKLPFRIRLEDRMSLTDQLADGLRHAIRSGVLRSGDTLPTLLEMADRMGVSEFVARHAVRRLSAEGLVCARRRVGIKVNGNVNAWKASVLGLQWGVPSMYYHSVLNSVVTERLDASNVLFDAKYISQAEADRGFPRVQADLAHAFSLAVIRGHTHGLDALLSRREIPFIHCTWSRPSPLAVRAILMRHALVFPAIRDHCLACGVRDMLLVGLPGDTHNIQLRRLLTAAGVRCRSISVQPIDTFESPEDVERSALNAMDAWLEREKQLPDLIWFSDDFVARGALLAMTARGVRIPEDVQVITLTNRGMAPAFIKPLTRVEMDPARDGEAIAASVLEQLDGKPWDGKPIVLAPTFIAGATTIKKVKLHRS
jgi:DNA-binding LacI/PurR family transcriptional regulator